MVSDQLCWTNVPQYILYLGKNVITVMDHNGHGP